MKPLKVLSKLGLPFWLLLASCMLLTFSQSIYTVILFALSIIPVILNQRNIFDFESVVLLLWSIIYFFMTAFYYPPNSWANEIGYLIAPLAFYLGGKYFTRKLPSENGLMWMIFFVCIASEVIIIIMTITDISQGGLISYSRKFEDDEAQLAATLYGLVAAISLSGLGFFISNRSKASRFLQYAFLILFCGALLITIHLINRTGIFVAVICTVVMMLAQKPKKTWFKVLLIGLLVASIVIYYGTDLVEETLTAYQMRNRKDFDIESGGGRLSRWGDAVGKFMLYPMGWWLDGTTYRQQVHNMWLDIARVGGILPFFLFLVFTIKMGVTQLQLFKRHRTNPVVMLTFGILLSIVLACSVEPVIEAKLGYFTMLLFFAGVERQLQQQLQYNRYLKR